jgi:hypothetical protein
MLPETPPRSWGRVIIATFEKEQQDTPLKETPPHIWGKTNKLWKRNLTTTFGNILLNIVKNSL